jgi:hypothetical protein
VNSSYEVVAEIVRANPVIESLTLVTYIEGPNWRDLAKGERGPDVGLLLQGIRQDSGKRILTKIARKDVSASHLRGIAHALNSEKLLGVASKVGLEDGRTAHIPMMDFMCGVSDANAKVLARLLSDLAQGRGCLLVAGNSYHYYGFRLLQEA